MKSTPSDEIQHASITTSTRLSSSMSVASVLSDTTVKASNRGIMGKRKVRSIAIGRKGACRWVGQGSIKWVWNLQIDESMIC